MRDIAKLALRLLIFTLAAGLLLAATNEITREPIAEQNEQIAREARSTVLVEASDFQRIENDATDAYPFVDAVYAGLDGGEVVGYTFSLSPMGFKAEIEMTLGVNTAGAITGLAINNQSETAGLGNRIADDAYLSQYLGLAADAATVDAQVDAISGATVSSHAVLTAVEQALEYADAELDIAPHANPALAENRTVTEDDRRRVAMIAGGRSISELSPYAALDYDAIWSIYEVSVKGERAYVFDMISESYAYTLAIGANGVVAGATIESPKDAEAELSALVGQRAAELQTDGLPEALSEGLRQAASFYLAYLAGEEDTSNG